MLSRIEVRDYQSLRSADIPLGRLTVITGPTGSGKSAFIRAVRLLALNARGTSYIRRGQKTCSVSAGTGLWIARLTRSSARGGKNQYQVARHVGNPSGSPDGLSWTAVTYTKLEGRVPPQVTELLGLSELNFARQLDPPYLLDLPGTEVARRLGDLTNVSLVLGAAAEANRARKRHQHDLDAARARRAALLEEAQAFAGLRERRRACTAAEEGLARARALAARAERLRSLAGRLEAVELAAAQARAEAARQVPPDLSRLEKLAGQVSRLRALGGSLERAESDLAAGNESARKAQFAEIEAEEALHAALASAGHCPVCGQRVS